MNSENFEIDTKLNLSVLRDPDSPEENENDETLEARSEDSEFSSGTTLKTAVEKEPFTHIIEGVLNQIEVQSAKLEHMKNNLKESLVAPEELTEIPGSEEIEIQAAKTAEKFKDIKQVIFEVQSQAETRAAAFNLEIEKRFVDIFESQTRRFEKIQKENFDKIASQTADLSNRIASFSDFLAKMETSLNESRLRERQKRQQLRLMATMFGEPLGLSDPAVVKDRQFGLSSGRGGDLPRLDYSTWQPELVDDPEPFVEVDFQKPFVVRGLLLRSEKGAHYENLCLIKDVKIEFYDLSCARKNYYDGRWLIGNSRVATTQLVALPYPIKGMGIRIFLRGSLFMKCSLEILGDQVNLGEELDLDTGIYKRRTVDNHRTSHMIQPSFLTGVRIKISFLTDEACKVRQFSFFANDKENKSKHLTTFKAPKTTNTWVTYAFPKVMHTWSVQVEPKIDFKLGSDAVVRIKYQFLGYFDKGYSIGESTEETIRLETS